ncbi:hypothetical protein AB0C51_23220 [Streptomyces pathocidini]|uniref:hypothetical protein n=1 Tax=Streptomyces pathocidini TaxID=1650571 RepID=UPI0033E5C336
MKFTRLTTLTAAVAAAGIFSTGLSYATTAADHGGAVRSAAVTVVDEEPMTAAEELESAQGQRLISLLAVLDAMPETVVEQGEAAVQAYLAEHLPETRGVVAAFGWLQTAKCVAAIGAAVAGGAIPVAKLLKLRAFIKKVGSVKEAAYLLVRVAKGEEKLSELGATLGGLASVVLGIDQIKKQCR